MRNTLPFFFSFLSILLLAEGKTAYMGPTAEAISYFERYNIISFSLGITGKKRLEII